MNPSTPTTLGPCPACRQGELVEGRKAWGCSRWKPADGGCPFRIWKSVAGKPLTLDQMRTLLAGETTDVIHGFQNQKTLKIFSARLRMDNPETGHIAFVFDPRPTAPAVRKE